MRKRKWRGLSIEAERELRKLVQHEGFRNSVQIRDHLDAKFPSQKIPNERTIRNYVKALVPPDPSGAWSVAEDSDDSAFLLTVLGAVVERTEGRITQLTRKQAEWLERVKRALPDIPPWAAFTFARAYVISEAESHETAPFDMALALTLDAGAEHESGKARIARHVDLHVQRWPSQPLIAWARETWIANEYEEAAKSQPVALIIRDFAEMREGGGEVLVIRF